MSIRPPRWLRSARRRPAAFLALLTLSGFTVMVSTLAPMLLDSVSAAGLADRVAALSAPDDGVFVTAAVPNDQLLTTAQSAVDDSLGAVGTDSLFGAPQRVTVTAGSVGWRRAGSSAKPTRTTVSFADDCSGVRLLRGRCPASISEVALPASVASIEGLAVGSSLEFQQTQETPNVARVVGIYDDRRGHGAALADPDALTGSGLAHPVADPVLGAKRQLSLSWSFEVDGAVRIVRVVRPRDVPELRDVVKTALHTAFDDSAAQTSAHVYSGLIDVLDSIRAQQAAAVTMTTPIALDALALGWFALAFVVQRIARARAVEWGIGRSHGVRRGTWLGAVLLEPAIAIVVGAAAGLGAAVAGAEIVSAVAIGRNGSVDVTAPVTLAAAGLAAGGSLIALVVASARSASLPLDALLRDTTEPRRSSRLALVAQVAVYLSAAAVLISVLTSRPTTGPQLALALPVLLALVAGTLALRVTVIVVQRVARRPPRSLVALVAGRGLARAPSVLSAAVLVLVATALAAYALQLDAVSTRAQDDRADLLTGAATVLTVHVPKGTSLLAAVRKADPTGAVALAAEEDDSPGAANADRVIAVDTARIDAVSTWSRQWQGVPLTRLRPKTTQDLVLRGSRLSLTIASVRDGNAYPLPVGHDLQLDAVVARPSGWTTVSLGPLRVGVASASIPCSAGCRLVSLGVRDPDSAPSSWGTIFAISRISTDAESASTLAPWLDADRWRNRIATSTDPALPLRIFPVHLPERLVLDAQNENGGGPAEVEPASGSAALPAIGGSGADLTPFAGEPHVVFGSDLAGQPLLLHLEGRAPALPRALTDGVLVDLGQLQRSSDPSAAAGTDEVWLAPGSHRAVLAALARQGIRVRSSATSAAARALADRTLVPRSIGLVRITAVVAIAVALLALIAAWVIDVPIRRREWIALRLSGIPPTTLRTIAILRFVGPGAVAAVLGAPVAAVTFAISADRLPLLAGESSGPPIDFSPPWLLLAVLVAGLVVLAALIGVVGARLELPRRVR